MPTAKLKSTNIKSLILDYTHAVWSCIVKQMGVVFELQLFFYLCKGWMTCRCIDLKQWVRTFSLEKQCTSFRSGYMSNCNAVSKYRYLSYRHCWFLSSIHWWLESKYYWRHDALVCNFLWLVQTPSIEAYIFQVHAGAKFGTWLGQDPPSANTFVHAGCGQSATFNSHQIFWLYSIFISE